jgi:hypothetical protein
LRERFLELNRLVVLWPTLIVVGTVLTLTTVLVGNAASGYGFPLAWMTEGCAPPGIEASVACLRAIGSDWLSFGVDALLHTFVGYGVGLSYSKYVASRRSL